MKYLITKLRKQQINFPEDQLFLIFFEMGDGPRHYPVQHEYKIYLKKKRERLEDREITGTHFISLLIRANQRDSWQGERGTFEDNGQKVSNTAMELRS